MLAFISYELLAHSLKLVYGKSSNETKKTFKKKKAYVKP